MRTAWASQPAKQEQTAWGSSLLPKGTRALLLAHSQVHFTRRLRRIIPHSWTTLWPVLGHDTCQAFQVSSSLWHLQSAADGQSPACCGLRRWHVSERCSTTLFSGADDGGPGERLQLEDRQDFAELRFMESFESKHSDHGFTAKLAARLGVTQAPLRLDSQAKYGALARGDAAINLRFPHKGYREKIWDHVAGALIVAEAGGKISDASGELPWHALL